MVTETATAALPKATPTPDGLVIRAVEPSDQVAISQLHARTFGPGRFTRTAYRIREGAPAASRFCKAAVLQDRLVAAVRFTPCKVGTNTNGLFLGPIVVDPAFKNQHIGSTLISRALEDVDKSGIAFVILVGDEPYYRRHDFVTTALDQIKCPGPVAPDRILIRPANGADPSTIIGQIRAL
ncbi:MAG: N-acetyltransferase [Pseudomonadota bacterium]